MSYAPVFCVSRHLQLIFFTFFFSCSNAQIYWWLTLSSGTIDKVGKQFFILVKAGCGFTSSQCQTASCNWLCVHWNNGVYLTRYKLKLLAPACVCLLNIFPSYWVVQDCAAYQRNWLLIVCAVGTSTVVYKALLSTLYQCALCLGLVWVTWSLHLGVGMDQLVCLSSDQLHGYLSQCINIIIAWYSG